MKLASFSTGGPPRVGIVDLNHVYDVGRVDPTLSIETVLGWTLSARAKLETRVRAAGDPVPLGHVRLHVPVRPGTLFGIGLNYRSMLAEARVSAPERPAVFLKASTALLDPGGMVVAPPGCTSLDYEGELAVVIGRRCKDVTVARAWDVIGGYTVANDVTERAGLTADRLALAKGCDTFAPLGPWIVTADEIGPRPRLRLRTSVNGIECQDAYTDDVLFPIDVLIADLSRGRTLESGDVILTGSPAGVGARQSPPRFLAPGDSIDVDIERIGRLTSHVGRRHT